MSTLSTGFMSGFAGFNAAQDNAQQRQVMLFQAGLAARRQRAIEAEQAQQQAMQQERMQMEHARFGLDQRQEARQQHSADLLDQERMQQNLLLERKVANRRSLDQTVRQVLAARDAKVITPEMADLAVQKAAVQFADDPSDILQAYHQEQAQRIQQDREQRMGDQFQQNQQRMIESQQQMMDLKTQAEESKTAMEAQKVQMAQEKAAQQAELHARTLKINAGKAKVDAANAAHTNAVKMAEQKKSSQLKVLNAQLAAAAKMFDEDKQAEIQTKIDALLDDEAEPESVAKTRAALDAAHNEYYASFQDQQPTTATPGVPAGVPASQPAATAAAPSIAPPETGAAPVTPAASQPQVSQPHLSAAQQVVERLKQSGEQGAELLAAARSGDPQAKAMIAEMVRQLMQGAQQ